jgi:hypothetical protein
MAAAKTVVWLLRTYTCSHRDPRSSDPSIAYEDLTAWLSGTDRQRTAGTADSTDTSVATHTRPASRVFTPAHINPRADDLKRLQMPEIGSPESTISCAVSHRQYTSQTGGSHQPPLRLHITRVSGTGGRTQTVIATSGQCHHQPAVTDQRPRAPTLTNRPPLEVACVG